MRARGKDSVRGIMVAYHFVDHGVMKVSVKDEVQNGDATNCIGTEAQYLKCLRGTQNIPQSITLLYRLYYN